MPLASIAAVAALLLWLADGGWGQQPSGDGVCWQLFRDVRIIIGKGHLDLLSLSREDLTGAAARSHSLISTPSGQHPERLPPSNQIQRIKESPKLRFPAELLLKAAERVCGAH